MPEVDQGEIIRVLAPLVWRAADKMFKLVSWTAILVALRIAAKVTGSGPVQVPSIITTFVFSFALFLQSVYIAVRDPAGFGIPSSWHWLSRPIQIVTALALLMAVAGPPLYLDQIINALESAKLK